MAGQEAVVAYFKVHIVPTFSSRMCRCSLFISVFAWADFLGNPNVSRDHVSFSSFWKFLITSIV